MAICLRLILLVMLSLACSAIEPLCAAETWLQYKANGEHTGDVPERTVGDNLGLVGAVATTDAIFTSPVIAHGRVFLLDGSGVAHAFDQETLQPIWSTTTEGGKQNCNNVSSPLVVDNYLHFGTTAGRYYVLDCETGDVVKKIAVGDPIFSTPATGPLTAGGKQRVYFATLGSRIYALDPDGTICWQWDYVRDHLGNDKDRWNGKAWLDFKQGRATWRDQFCCARNIAVHGSTIAVPAGGDTVFLVDEGSAPKVEAIGKVPSYKGRETPSTLALSMDAEGTVYRQWYRRDNTGRVETMKNEGGKVQLGMVPGTQTRNDMPYLPGFSSVSVRGKNVYRTRPQEGYGFCRHSLQDESTKYLGGFPAIASPVLTKEHGVYGGLDGKVYVVPLSENKKVTALPTAFGAAITAPVAVCDGKIYVGCEDGYLYVYGANGKASLPRKDLKLYEVRSPLSSKLASAKYNWFTNYGSQEGTNSSNNQNLKPPFKINWIRRYHGTFKHIPICGGGRMYTHTAQGMIFAVEQETGRLLWRRYAPGVFLSYTAPVYQDEKIVVPQAGLKKSRLRCLDAATGKLLWETPFSGSPSWSRQLPPMIHDNVVVYMYSTGKYVPKGEGLYVMRGGRWKNLPESTAGKISWLYSHDNPFYPEGQKPILRGWDLETGKILWTNDFSEYGDGGDDGGMCLLDGTIYYSVFFGYAARRRGKPGPPGLTAAIDPASGKVKWKTLKYSVTGGCTVSGETGRIYLGGYNPLNVKSSKHHVYCLSTEDGSLIWKSEPVTKAINVVTVGPRFLFGYAYYSGGYLLDKSNGKLISKLADGYYCTRFTLSEPYLIGPNLDLIDLTNAKDSRLISTGPSIDVMQCVGGAASNGRLFYTTQGGGMQYSQVCGEEAIRFRAPWEKE